MDNINKQIVYWQKSAERDWQIALDLFKTKHYDACLFFCHLTLEKLLKSLVIKATDEPAPYIHDLTKLANLANLDLSTEQIKNLKIINQFNIAGRYDNIKHEFYKLCTKEYADKYLSITHALYLWLKKFLKK